MRQTLLLFVLICLMLVGYGQSISSSVIATAGGSSEAGGINLSWTMGELAIETFTTTNLHFNSRFPTRVLRNNLNRRSINKTYGFTNLSKSCY